MLCIWHSRTCRNWDHHRLLPLGLRSWCCRNCKRVKNIKVFINQLQMHAGPHFCHQILQKSSNSSVGIDRTYRSAAGTSSPNAAFNNIGYNLNAGHSGGRKKRWNPMKIIFLCNGLLSIWRFLISCSFAILIINTKATDHTLEWWWSLSLQFHTQCTVVHCATTALDVRYFYTM